MSEVAFLSDIHMREGHVTDVADALNRIVHRLTVAHDIEHIFVLGDLIEDTNDPDVDLKRVERVTSILETAPSPVTYLLGNHDIGALSRSTLSAALSQEQFYGRVDVGGIPFVYLDSTVKDGWARGALDREQLMWMSEELPEDAVVLIHHPIGNFSLENNNWFCEFPERAYLWNRKELLLGTQDRLRATISGHIHQPAHTVFNDAVHASTDAISKKGPNTPTKGRYLTLSMGEDPVFTWFVEDRERSSHALI